MNPIHARVFVGCGQATDAERGAADRVARLLEQMGFEPYVAIEQSSQ